MPTFPRLRAFGARIRAEVDASTIQAGIAAALSFSHLMAVAEAAGQTGWQVYAYPISVDLLLLASFRRARSLRGGAAVMPWLWFLVALAATLAANTFSVLGAEDVTFVMSLVVAGWPALALLGGTLLTHGTKPRGGPTKTAEPIVIPIIVPATPGLSLAPVLPPVPPVAPPPVDPETAKQPAVEDGPEVADAETGPNLLSPATAARMLEIPSATVRSWVRAGKVRNYGAHGAPLIDLDEVASLARERSERLPALTG
ncbi:DUF2637 domain-containing protein [Streptomyces sp. SM12]|uniref:DUF2637 domain-containing protein n=1 Tax=Streptomyces sp. SM12 TaxID=1071602 RepID=UPI000CD55D46|nr:DUF2637 domain-containing protein [Streptomyces sp. SM12]